MTEPKVLRARARVSLDEMAARLRVPAADLRTLEATPIDLWEVRTVREYVEALGYVLHVQAFGRDAVEVLA